MSWTIGRKIGAGFALALLILIAIGTVSYRSTNRLIDANHWVTHTYQVLSQLERVMSALTDAETGQRGYILTGMERFLGPHEKALASIDAAVKELRKLTADNANQQRRLAVLESLVASRLEVLREGIELRRQKGLDAAATFIQSERGSNIMDEIRGTVDEMKGDENALLERRSQETEATTRNTLDVIVFGTLAALVLVGIVGVTITRSVSVQILQGVNLLVSSASEILAATTQQASGTAEEATAVQQTSATVDEVKQTAQVSAQKARAVAEGAQRSMQVSQDGRRAVEDGVKGMQETKARMEAIAEKILALSERAQAIGDVIVTVNDLAEQSNLLAVNAGIEAAKAGEAGRGFAVVAAEVKAMAEQSKQATAQVRGILGEIQRATQSAVMAAEQGVKASDQGVALATRSGDAIRLLAESLTESAQSAQQILASIQQQVAGTDQIVLAMRNIQAASAQNMASTSQVEKAAQDLNELAGRLKGLVRAADGEDGPKRAPVPALSPAA